jgi:hypothetical protein
VRNSAGQRYIGSLLITTLCDFSFREPVVRIKLIFYQHLSDFFFSKQDIYDDKHQHKIYIVWSLCVPRNVTSGNGCVCHRQSS